MLYPEDNDMPLTEIEKYELLNEIKYIEETFNYDFPKLEDAMLNDLLKNEVR